MGHVKVFNGFYESITSDGRIKVQGSDETAVVTLTDRQGKSSSARVTVYDVRGLKNTPEYKSSSNEVKVVPLYHTWNIIDSANNKIVYSEEVDQAFIFKMTADFDFAKVVPIAIFELTYFQEISFLEALEDESFTIDQLRQAEGMTPGKLDLFFENHLDIRRLRKVGIGLDRLISLPLDKLCHLLHVPGGHDVFKSHGFTVDEVLALPVEKFSNLQKNAHALGDALKLVTKNQILGIDHLPLEIPSAPIKIDCKTRISGYQSSFSNGYTIISDHEKTSLSYSSSTSGPKLTAVVSLDTISLEQEGSRYLYASAMEGVTPERLVHNWWKIGHANESNVNMMISPEIPEIMRCKIDPGFPFDQISDELTEFQYFNEKAFVAFMAKNNLPIQEARKMEGFSQTKLEILCQNRHLLYRFLEKGLTLHDFANIDENRLHRVLTEYTKGDAALKFVDVFELFALRKPGPLLTLYASRVASAQRPVVVRQEGASVFSNCTLM